MEQASSRRSLRSAGPLIMLAVAALVAGSATLAHPSAPGAASAELEAELETIQLPPGFRINLFAAGLGYARFMTFSPQGDLMVTSSTRVQSGGGCGGGNCINNDGRVIVLPDRDRDGVADRMVVFADGLDRPSGIAYHDGLLHVGTHGQVLRLPDRDGDLEADSVEVVVPDLPRGPGHWSRTVAFGRDGTMHVHAGSSCNVCEEENERRAAITQFNSDGSDGRLFARGLRNAVGLAFHPTTGELWATNNQRDLLDDDLPPEYVSIVREGDHFGWPFCHVGVPDPEYGHLGSCSQARAPTVLLPAHTAPLGLAFYTGQQFPSEYHGDLFVALHGSWNRSSPVGYKLVRIPVRGSVPGPVEDFATGFLPDPGRCNNSATDLARGVSICRGDAWGRPVDVAVGPDGSMYVSDDVAGAIYRITYAP